MTGVENLRIRQDTAGAVLAVKVVPGASRSKIAGVLGDALKLAVAAPPEKGKANLAAVKLLAETLGVDSRAVQLVSGQSNPRKEFRIVGLTVERLRERLTSA